MLIRVRCLACLPALGFLAILLLGKPVGALETLAADPAYVIRSWHAEEGLPGSSVSSIIQTREGYLWIGTYNGLARFDGVRFTVFDPSRTPELKNSRVTCLFEDAGGCLWIGHESGDLTRYEAGRFHWVELRKPEIRPSIVRIGQDETGEVWALNAAGFLVRVRDGFALAPPANSVDELGLMVSRDATLWLTRGGTLSVLSHRNGADASLSALVSDGFVQAACAARDGGLWVLRGESIRKWANGKWAAKSLPSPVAQRAVTRMLETSSGALAVGTQADGLYLLTMGGEVTQISRAKGLSANWVRALWEDREGNLWVGTGNGGLDLLRPSQVSVVVPPAFWAGHAFLSVCAARDGGLWVGTEGSGLFRYREGTWTHLGEADGLTSLFVWSVLEDNRGMLWVGTWSAGLLERKEGRFEVPPGLRDLHEPVTALFQDSRSNLWVGSRTGVLRLADGRQQWYGRATGFPLADVRALAEDAAGAIWIGMLGGGLACLQDGVLEQFHNRDGLASDLVASLHSDAAGALWIGTLGGGLSRRKQGRFTTIGTAQGLPNNVILSIADDGQGHFWMSSHGGLFRVDKAELNRCADGQLNSLPCLLYGRSEGMPTLECSGECQPAVAQTADNHLWFPTRRGLVGVTPGLVVTNALPPPVVLEEVLVQGHPVPLPANATPLTLQPGQGRLEIHYAGLCFSAPEQVRFKYRLEGLESDWVEAGNQRSVTYNYLPPNSYTFHVIACNNDGVWNETGASLRLAVRPHFWQTWTFRLLAGLLAAATVAGIVWWVSRRRWLRELERLEQQQAIDRERVRIARDIHDDLGANLTRITLLSQPPSGATEAAGQAAANRRLVNQTARELTRAMDEIVWAVNPRHDTLNSLAAYLGKFAQDFLEPVDIRCRLDIPMQLPPAALSGEVRHNLFLAFKEALNNIAKYSRATEAHVSLSLDTAQFTLIVEDNGQGFTPSRPGTEPVSQADRVAGGNGLRNMCLRMEKIKGRCEILSAPGTGAKVRLTVNADLNRLTSRPADS